MNKKGDYHMMKKLTVLWMSLMLIFSLAACGNNQEAGTSATTDTSSESSSESTNTSSSTTENSTSTAEIEETEGTGGKTLVVYYSATGNTEAVANYISDATGADVLELEPVEPYTDEDLNWTDEESRVVYEHDNPKARDMELVADTVDNWEEYDTVFIGYPIWWGIAAWPVDAFIEANDFTGKTVVPFATSASSDLGESGELLEEMAGSGEWMEGQRFSSSVSEEEVQEWVESLGL